MPTGVEELSGDVGGGGCFCHDAGHPLHVTWPSRRAESFGPELGFGPLPELVDNEELIGKFSGASGRLRS